MSNDNTCTVKDFAKTQTLEPDSKTKVHFSEGHVPSYVCREREPITVRIDRSVYKEYKPLAKRIYGSTCKAVETHMISLIEVAKIGVYFSHTEKPIHIEKIVIERSLGKERRNLRENVSDSQLTEVDTGRCQFCRKQAIGLFRYKVDGRVFGLCGFHSDEFVNRQGSWEFVRNG